MKKIFLSLLFLAFALPFSANSAEIITEPNVNLGESSTFLENLYIGSGQLNISSLVDSDLTILSGESIVSSRVTGDVFIAGGRADFFGEVEGDLRVVGGTVFVSGTVVGDLLIIGGEVNISKDSTLLNDIFLIGGEINFEGDSPKRLKVVSGKVRINGAVAGESEITTQSLEVGPDSIIDGIFSYYSPQKFTETSSPDGISGAEILGTVNYNKINTLRDTGIVKKTIVNFLNFWLLLKFITTLIIGFLLVYVFKVFAVEVNKVVINSFWKSLLAGFLVVLVLPIVIILFLVSLVAMPVGLLLLIAFIFMMIIAPAIAGLSLGSWFRKRIGKKQEYLVDFHSVTIGIILFTLLQFVPIVGDLLRLVFILVALGATVRYLKRVIVK